MIEHTDITILGTTTLKNKLSITDPQQLATARPTSPRFDSLSFESLLSQAASTPYTFRRSITMFTRTFTIGPESCAAWTPATDPRPMLSTSLNAVFDRLARENHLKGGTPEEWSHSAPRTFMNLELSSRFSLPMKSHCVSLPMSWHVRIISASDGTPPQG